MSTEERQASDTTTQERRAGDTSTGENPGSEPKTDDHHQVIEQPDPSPPTEKPEITDEHKETAKEMLKDNVDDRPTIVMPGTDGGVSGTAVNDWVDDDGNPKFSDKSKDESKNE